MKKQILFLIFTLCIATGYSQQYQVYMDTQGNKILKGFITKTDLSTDTAFAWFSENQKGFVPDVKAVQLLKANSDSIYLVIFGGTWCGDTHQILPHVLALTEAAAFPENHLTLLGVDREKKTISNLSEVFGITNVPTVIAFKKGKEIGRVIEFGESGNPIEEIGKIIEKSK